MSGRKTKQDCDNTSSFPPPPPQTSLQQRNIKQLPRPSNKPPPLWVHHKKSDHNPPQYGGKQTGLFAAGIYFCCRVGSGRSGRHDMHVCSPVHGYLASGSKQPAKQLVRPQKNWLGGRLTFVLQRKTTRDRLIEEKSSYVQQTRKYSSERNTKVGNK